MASRLARNTFKSSRTTFSRARTQSFNNAGRRYNSSAADSHAAPKSSDTPWIVGSLVAFGPAFLYLASPYSRASSPHDSHKSAKSEKPKAKPALLKDDEGTEADVSESVAKAEVTDAPQSDGAAIPQSEPSGTVADDEGTEVPAKEVAESVEKGVAEDSPQSSGAVSKGPEPHENHPSEPAEGQLEQKEKPSQGKSGTFQSKEDEGPTNLGDARQAAVNKTVPKEVEDKSS